MVKHANSPTPKVEIKKTTKTETKEDLRIATFVINFNKETAPLVKTVDFLMKNLVIKVITMEEIMTIEEIEAIETIEVIEVIGVIEKIEEVIETKEVSIKSLATNSKKETALMANHANFPMMEVIIK